MAERNAANRRSLADQFAVLSRLLLPASKPARTGAADARAHPKQPQLRAHGSYLHRGSATPRWRSQGPDLRRRAPVRTLRTLASRQRCRSTSPGEPFQRREQMKKYSTASLGPSHASRLSAAPQGSRDLRLGQAYPAATGCSQRTALATA